MAEPPKKVFISYSHDGAEHEERVLALADRLRDDGIDATIDQYVPMPPEGWPAWCERRIAEADVVLMVCTETYQRRVSGEEVPGKGLGVLCEARIIRQLVYDAGSVSAKFVPILFSDGSDAHVPLVVRGTTRFAVDTDDGYLGLCRVLTDQPATPPRPLGKRKTLPPKPRRSSGTAAKSVPLATEPAASAEPHPRVEDLFVGRDAERLALTQYLLPDAGTPRRPVVVTGMAGVGKSYLVDRWFWENRERFPGGYLRLPLDPEQPGTAADALAALRDRLKLPAGDAEALAARLQSPAALLHVENADTRDAGRTAAGIAAALSGCAIVISARYRDLGSAAKWPRVDLVPFDGETARRQLDAEFDEERPQPGRWDDLAAALGRLPLALHLAAGHLRSGYDVDGFLRRLWEKGLALDTVDPAHPTFQDRSRALLSDSFGLSLEALRREGGKDGRRWIAGFAALGHAPAAGFGESLGAAIAGLPPEAFKDMTVAAARHSLLDRTPRRDSTAFRLHPLLAELGRSRAKKETAVDRMTAWFIERLPEGGEDQGQRWQEIGAETVALVDWLATLPAFDRMRVKRAGTQYALFNGPYLAWMRFCEELLKGEIDAAVRSEILWTLGVTALSSGQHDRALAAASEKRELDRHNGAEHEAALASSLIADILQARGELVKALRIRREEEMPVYERLGNARAVAITMAKIADILRARDPDAALNTLGQDVLPAFLRLGDVRSTAVTKAKIAGIFRARGDTETALRLLREEALPVYENLGDVRDSIAVRTNIATLLLERARNGDREEANRLLCRSLADARRLELAVATEIQAILNRAGLTCP